MFLISPTEILQTLTFILSYFSWLDVVPKSIIVEINRVAMLVHFSIWRISLYSA